MNNSFKRFKIQFIQTKGLSDLYNYLDTYLNVPMKFDDILRSQFVYAVSSLDKLIHDLIRIGMIEIFLKKRPPTPKYLAEPLSLETIEKINNATMPPKEHFFEQAIFNKFVKLSFQNPTNIADGLSYIWDEKHKWQKIAQAMGSNEQDIKTQLKLIVNRRNQIVHEADLNFATGEKYFITPIDSKEAVEFIELCGASIATLII